MIQRCAGDIEYLSKTICTSYDKSTIATSYFHIYVSVSHIVAKQKSGHCDLYYQIGSNICCAIF